MDRAIVSMSFSAIVRLAISARTDGIVLNPFTDNFTVRKEAFKLF